MEDEIDLKPYFLAVWQNWQSIAALSVLLATLLGLYQFITIPQFEAQQLVVVQVSGSNDILLDIEKLATSEDVEIQVVDGLRAINALPPNYQVGMLKSQVEVERNGIFLRIIARADTTEKAQQLMRLWKNALIKVITETFSRDDPAISLTQRQLEQAQARYQEAQTALEEFIITSELNIASQEVSRLNDLIESFRRAAFTQLNEYLTRRNEIDLILRDAYILRSRLVSDGSDDVANATAALLLYTRNLSERSNQIILQFDSSIVATTEISVDSVERLIQSLEEEYRALSLEIEKLKSETNVALFQDLNKQLRAAQLRFEQLNTRYKVLTWERDLLSNKVEQLRQRLEELQAERPIISIREVRTDEIVTRSPRLLSLLLYSTLGGVAGVILGIGFIVGREAIRQTRISSEAQQKLIGD